MCLAGEEFTRASPRMLVEDLRALVRLRLRLRKSCSCCSRGRSIFTLSRGSGHVLREAPRWKVGLQLKKFWS